MKSHELDAIHINVYYQLYTRTLTHRKEAAINSREVLKKLEADGWYVVRTRGSHHQLKHQMKKGLVTLPHPKKDLPKGTLRSIEHQSGVALLN